jgi:uncharacterized damage-inducible protein DinB
VIASASALVRDQFDHLEWADAMVWSAVFACPPTADDDRLRGYLAHQHSVQRAFLDAWTEQPFTFRDASHFAGLRAVYDFASTYYAPAREFVHALTDERLGETRILPWANYIASHLGRPIEPTLLSDTITQVIAHSAYHRGQINARLREVGGEPPLVDFIAWVWLGRPHAAWPS